MKWIDEDDRPWQRDEAESAAACKRAPMDSPPPSLPTGRSKVTALGLRLTWSPSAFETMPATEDEAITLAEWQASPPPVHKTETKEPARPLTEVTSGKKNTVNWLERAACRGSDTKLFFPSDGEYPAAAVLICAKCPVRVQCSDEADASLFVGVWGGVNRTLRGGKRGRVYRKHTLRSYQQADARKVRL